MSGSSTPRGFYGLGDLFGRLPTTRYVKPAIGGLLVGTMALGIPQVLGTGYGWVQLALGRTSLLHMSLAIVLLLPLRPDRWRPGSPSAREARAASSGRGS